MWYAYRWRSLSTEPRCRVLHLVVPRDHGLKRAVAHPLKAEVVACPTEAPATDHNLCRTRALITQIPDEMDGLLMRLNVTEARIA